MRRRKEGLLYGGALKVGGFVNVAAGPDSLKVDGNPADSGRCGGWVQEAEKRRRGDTRGLST